MVLTIPEIAKCFGLSSNTVERWIRQGKIPIQRRNNSCIFNQSILEKWAENHHMPFEMTVENTGNELKYPVENLLAAMKRGRVFYNPDGTDVGTILQAAAFLIPDLKSNVKQKIYEKLVEREKLTSTGIGKGIAIPHPRICLSSIKESLITTCFLKKPIDFAAVDNEPVFVLFILLSPTVKTHLQLLSRLSFCLRDVSFVEFLKNCPSEDQLLTIIADFEKQFEKSNSF
ncbi:MAG: PTS sugar transporter subunit IIA [Desulfobacterales bacterium]|nr:PTS sugar transporter subunit IIA [Desulfobacterales bacterium]